jgi:hypothetical protein
MSRWVARLWARIALSPRWLQRLQLAAIISAVLCLLLLGVGFSQLNRVRKEAESYRAAVLAPPEQPELAPEEALLLETVQKIAAQLTSVPNAQAFTISQISQRAQQHGLSIAGVETSEPPGGSGAPSDPSGWSTRLLRFRVNGSSQQILRWLQKLETAPLVITLTGVQLTADSGAEKGVSAVVEMEVLLPPAGGGRPR